MRTRGHIASVCGSKLALIGVAPVAVETNFKFYVGQLASRDHQTPSKIGWLAFTGTTTTLYR